MMPRKLPTFQFRRAEYTVDYWLREFRHVEYGKWIEFIAFDSPRGQRLLKTIARARNRAARRRDT
jgi:hypothetical protein